MTRMGAEASTNCDNPDAGLPLFTPTPPSVSQAPPRSLTPTFEAEWRKIDPFFFVRVPQISGDNDNARAVAQGVSKEGITLVRAVFVEFPDCFVCVPVCFCILYVISGDESII